MRQIIIGKQGSQPFPINDPNVSRRHAVLNIDERTNTMTLVDNNSTNGTYIYNGRSFARIMANNPVAVTPDTMIQLGDSTRFHIRRLLPAATAQPAQQPKQQPKPQQPPQQKYIDIRPLRTIYDNYQNNKLEIESKTGTINTLRSATLIVSLVAGGAGKFIAPLILDKDDPNAEAISWALGIGVAVVLITALFITISTMNKKISIRRSENERNFALKYVCPVCHMDLRNKLYENLLAEGSCPKCKSKFVEGYVQR